MNKFFEDYFGIEEHSIVCKKELINNKTRIVCHVWFFTSRQSVYLPSYKNGYSFIYKWLRDV